MCMYPVESECAGYHLVTLGLTDYNECSYRIICNKINKSIYRILMAVFKPFFFSFLIKTLKTNDIALNEYMFMYYKE